MKVLVIGQGGREHALAWKLAQSEAVRAVYTAPGNHGTARIGENVDLPVTAADDLAGWAERHAVDLTVVGPEAALAAGVTDAFRARGLPIFGPTRAAARLESSKAWAKAFMLRHGIPTAASETFITADEAARYLRGLPSDSYPLVVKMDGLAAGKGVRIALSPAEALEAVRAAPVVIEEFLSGFEVSFLAISDGRHARPLACAHDYKRAYEGERGPMTGGMGAYSPLGLEDAITTEVMATVIEPAIRGMAEEGTPYTGILYAGLMLTDDGPRVLEFNARFGDPETQVLLPRWDDDLARVLAAAAAGRLAAMPPFRWSAAATCGIVLAAAGYPEAPRVGDPILGLERAADDALIFEGGTRSVGGVPVTAGGRVLTVVGRRESPADARAAAYRAIAHIDCQGAWCRRDIGREPVASAPGVGMT